MTIQHGHAPPVIRKGEVASLNGLRCIAITSVLALHVGMPGTRLGGIGVDLFFVVSGFLITTLLLQEHETHGRISLRNFWARRFLRLMPLYFAFVGGMTVWMLLGATPLTGRPDLGWTPGLYIASMWGYFINYAPAFGIWVHQHLVSALWSLAVEEQFYFIWPPLLLLALRMRHPWKLLVVVMAAMMLRRLHVDDVRAFMFRLDTRGIFIVVGCLVAMLGRQCRQSNGMILLAHRGFRALIVTTLFALCLAAWILNHFHAWSVYRIHRVFDLPLAVGFAILVTMLWYGPRDVWDRVLSYSPLVYVGKISYGLYVLHLVVRWFVWDVLTVDAMASWTPATRYGVRVILFAALTLGLAALSYRFYESRFLALKTYFRSTGAIGPCMATGHVDPEGLLNR